MTVWDSLARFSENRKAVTGVLVGTGLLLVGLPLLLQTWAWSRAATNQEIRASLDQVQASRGKIAEYRSKKDAMASRYANKAPELGSFLERLAKEKKLDLTDSQPRADAPAGGLYTERSTVVHVKKTSLLPIARFTEAIEASGHPVTINRLLLRKRAGENDSYDLELGISAYDRKEPEVKKDAKDAKDSKDDKGTK